MALLFIFAGVLWLAYSNGANDNFKGVATLYGSDTADYKKALIWATVTTAAGCVVSVIFAEKFVLAFSGKGLIPQEILGTEPLLIAVELGSAATIFLASLLGMPTSTTHSLIGALLGVAMVSQFSEQASWLGFWKSFGLPLLISPFAAIGLTALFYPLARFSRRKMGVNKETCICIDNCAPQVVHRQSDGSLVVASTGLRVRLDEVSQCADRYSGSLVGVRAQSVVDGLHYLSGGAVCFSRAVNDTPKIAVLLFAAKLGQVHPAWVIGAVVVAMCVGGLLHSRRVAETMSKRITSLSDGEGLSANLVTALLVLVASRLGMPVSTTHVSCGSIFGIGLVNRSGQWKTILGILLAWVTTLPLAALIASAVYLAVRLL